jgi:hypothetical protein
MKLTLILLLILLSKTAYAEPTVLSATQLRTIIVNNSLVWDDSETNQKQYFNDTAQTVVDHDGTTKEMGQWTVPDDGILCSKWESDERWNCFEVSQESNKIYWKAVKDGTSKGDGEPIVATMIPTTPTETGIIISLVK